MLLSIATVFYLDIDSDAMAAVAAAGVLFALVRPASPARVPVLAHRLALARQTGDALEERRAVGLHLKRILSALPPPV